MTRVSDSRVSITDVLRFVWSYWRQLPLRLALIVAGVLVVPFRGLNLWSGTA